MHMAWKSVVLIVSLMLMLATGVFAQTAPAKSPLTIEQLIDIRHPSNPVWAPDGKHIAFIWDRAGVSNLYVASSERSEQPVALTSFPEGGVDEFFWSQDSQTIFFPRSGDLWEVAASSGTPKPVWTTPTQESEIVLSPDGKRVAFVRSNSGGGEDSRESELIVRSLADMRRKSGERAGIARFKFRERVEIALGRRITSHLRAQRFEGWQRLGFAAQHEIADGPTGKIPHLIGE